ncbi:TPA: 6-phosphogluconolactonase [Burkholderia aenigmatica]|uniref:6-phosphogluconolactonase n=1 Tax=Burkholderia sp. AU45251 TaxID=3059204 RepID=UPI0026548A9F|nr:6-phosphogluconolactonase [Burkholderia sp. AU45251]HDR9485875.1 6-phosphogluconolactonase [Burkholderia aenigmatica]MDN7519257.1 6-phosphogluconolactonase [Burkholderia sp. AU45251]HDR9517242.1 6-phosphogluconolactonase [Burkholderia aenigmatica]HDR9594298.1 6-phosphogluconolactonase [Burkholderia aenigmatica]HDR9601525.1 6-phosphogluconolactonase [Burkholderia aenigmatica]
MIEIHAFDTQEAQSDALARAVGDALRAALAGPARPTLAVSGGTSPRPFLQTLSHAALDWAGVDVTLVDDRWVPEDDAASNAHLVRDTLLQHAAAPARFLPLVDTRAALDAHVAALNANADYRVPTVAVLGMGEDGHTASIFADALEWEHAITTPERFVAVHPGAAPHARVSFSLDALKRVDRLFLLIAGERKRAVLDAAAASLQKNAISQLANDKGTQLDVYWCAK